jgi:hypothetical protein
VDGRSGCRLDCDGVEGSIMEIDCQMARGGRDVFMSIMY